MLLVAGSQEFSSDKRQHAEPVPAVAWLVRGQRARCIEMNVRDFYLLAECESLWVHSLGTKVNTMEIGVVIIVAIGVLGVVGALYYWGPGKHKNR